MAFDKDIPTASTSLQASNPQLLANQSAIQTALDQDHEFTNASGSAQSGKHQVITFKEQSTPGASSSNEAYLTAVDSGTQPELEFTSEDGTAVTLTADGTINIQTTDITNIILDEDDMASDSATKVPSQQSVKAYADEKMPVGTVVPYAGSSAPTGWLICDGTAYDSITNTEYAPLYSIIGNTYGGSTGADFEVPDLQGRVAVGVGTGTDAGAVSETFTLGGTQTSGGTDGEYEHTLTVSEMPAHTHEFDVVYSTNYTDKLYNMGSQNAISTTQKDTASTGGDGAHNNIQPFLGLNYIIKY